MSPVTLHVFIEIPVTNQDREGHVYMY
jgi:hypothetical protein